MGPACVIPGPPCCLLLLSMLQHLHLTGNPAVRQQPQPEKLTGPSSSTQALTESGLTDTAAITVTCPAFGTMNDLTPA